MSNAPFVRGGWMLASMVVVGGGVAWGWAWWFIGLLGFGLLSAAYMTARNAWNQSRDNDEKIRTSVNELQQVVHGPDVRSSLPVSPEAVGAALKQAVAQAKSRMANLEDERAKIVAIMENLVEGVLAFDPQGQVLFSNPSACRILGLDGQQLMGRSVWEVVRHAELAELVERSRKLDLHDSHRVEMNLHAPTPMAVEVYGLPFPLVHEKNGSVLVLHDVTELRRLEQVRAEFIDNVSHELRTPLAAIIGYLETLIDEPTLDTPNNRKFVHVAHQHAERLSRLVDDLRSLSEIESGKVVLRCEAVGLQDIVNEVVEMFQPQVQKKQIHLDNQIDDGARVWVDRDRIIQILLNLVDNAIKYSSERGSIVFQMQRLDKSLVLHVKDTGQGIPSTDLVRITERFYRVDRARSREEGGTGLGLSIVKHLVNLLNGQLRIHSALGKGTTVEVELPISTK